MKIQLANLTIATVVILIAAFALQMEIAGAIFDNNLPDDGNYWSDYDTSAEGCNGICGICGRFSFEQEIRLFFERG